MSIACPRLEFVGSASLTPDGAESSYAYMVHGAKTIEDARECLCKGVPLSRPGRYVKATEDEPCMTFNEDGELIQVTLPGTDDAGNPIEIPQFDVLAGETKCIWPKEWLVGLNIESSPAQNKGHWAATARYEGCVLEGFELSFGTTGGTVHIKNSLETVDKCPDDACDFYGMIGVQHGGEVNGCDIVAANPRLTIRKCHPPGFFRGQEGCTKFAELACIVGCTNEEQWDPTLGASPNACFDPQELLFLGADGSIPRYGPSRVNYHFEFQKTISKTFQVVNGVNPLSGEVTTGPQTKIIRGHQKVWTRNERGIIVGCDFEIMPIEALYIERVYGVCPFADFGRLGYGFGPI